MTGTGPEVALVSCRELPEADPDAAPLLGALEAAGVRAAVLAWDDPGVDWSAARLTVLRSTWNYPLRRDAFLEWASHVSARSTLWNPLEVVRWNTHKGYLVELERRGLPVTPTVLLRRGAGIGLDAVLSGRDWDEVVIKPAISAASFRTRRFDRPRREESAAHLADLLAAGDVLVQRYLPSVESHGERALVWIDGELTHAVRKTPRFEGQDEAVSAEPVPISTAEAALARRVIAGVAEPLLYARVDVAPGPDGDPVLMELELVEPSLFFVQGPAGLERFVRGVRRRLDADEINRRVRP